MSMNQLQLLNLGVNGRKKEPVLSTRERGRAAADRVQEALDKGSVVINFASVEVATPSYLDEVIRRLSGLLRGNEDRLVLIEGANEDVTDSLELVLEKNRMALAAVKDNQLELLGGSAQLKKTLDTAQELGSFSAADLAKELELKLPNLHQRLKELMESGAIAREPDESATRGKRHRYDTADPTLLETLA
jgi:DNA-binding MarR family transcriptional regulator